MKLSKHTNSAETTNINLWVVRYTTLPMQFLRVLFSKRSQCDRSIPPKLSIFTGHPKWQCDNTILNAKTKKELVFRFSYFTFESEKRKRNSFFVRKLENQKLKRNSFFVGKFKNENQKMNSLSVFRSQI